MNELSLDCPQTDWAVPEEQLALGILTLMFAIILAAVTGALAGAFVCGRVMRAMLPNLVRMHVEHLLSQPEPEQAPAERGVVVQFPSPTRH
ncbi:hypothetical protein AB4099_25610 [Bosea sp. 2KB_26]|uniref:hypothetical protein n=1 Tax=Bosea sp. 2KB_26 TaxID=3237475 RepID=UPI003F91D28B